MNVRALIALLKQTNWRKPSRAIPLALLGLGLAYGIYVAAVFGWAAYDEAKGKAAWEKYAREAAGRGLKLDVRDYTRAPIPEAQNFGACPLFVNALADEQAQKVFELPERDPRTAKRKKGVKAELERWREAFAQKRWLRKDDATPTPEALWKVLEARYAKPWAELTEAAKRPDCIFPVRWELGLKTPQGHLVLLMAASRFAALRTQIKLVEGNSAEALVEWKLLQRLWKAVEKEPGIIDGLVEQSLEMLSVSLLLDGLELRAWTDSELQTIEQALREGDPISDWAWMVNSERAIITDVLLHINERNDGSLKEFLGSAEDSTFNNHFLGIYHSLLQINLEADEGMKNFDGAGHRYRHVARPAMDLTKGSTFSERRRFLLYQVSHVPFNEPSMMMKFAFTASLLDQARLACALERFRLAQTHYPETLAELAPKYIDAIPQDVVTGTPLHYRLEGDGFVLYSIGDNEADDGGRSKYATPEEGDWTWGVSWR